jgi:hypothetical protein
MKNMSSKHSLPLRRALAVICGLQLLVIPCLPAQEADIPALPAIELAEETFSLSEPIPIKDMNGNTQLLQGMDAGQLRLAFPNMPGAEAIVPVDGRDLRISIELPANYNRLLTDYEQNDYDSFLRGLKPVAEPLAGFLSIPPAKTNIHGVFDIYYRVITAAGDLDEAVALTVRMPWDALPETYFDAAERLTQRTIEEQAFHHTEKLLALFNQALSDEAFAEMAFGIADALRTEGRHELATKVYGSLARSDDPVLSQKSLLWAGYSRSVGGNPAGARSILDRVDPIERDDENFLTYCLALGRLGYAEGNLRDGLRYLARAMVLTAVDATFKPELYYLLTTGYLESGNEVAANRLAAEFKVFYPESPWLKKYETETGENL